MPISIVLSPQFFYSLGLQRESQKTLEFLRLRFVQITQQENSNLFQAFYAFWGNLDFSKKPKFRFFFYLKVVFPPWNSILQNFFYKCVKPIISPKSYWDLKISFQDGETRFQNSITWKARILFARDWIGWIKPKKPILEMIKAGDKYRVEVFVLKPCKRCPWIDHGYHLSIEIR